jgi:hypothetical protein
LKQRSSFYRPTLSAHGKDSRPLSGLGQSTTLSRYALAGRIENAMADTEAARVRIGR